MVVAVPSSARPSATPPHRRDWCRRETPRAVCDARTGTIVVREARWTTTTAPCVVWSAPVRRWPHHVAVRRRECCKACCQQRMHDRGRHRNDLSDRVYRVCLLRTMESARQSATCSNGKHNSIRRHFAASNRVESNYEFSSFVELFKTSCSWWSYRRLQFCYRIRQSICSNICSKNLLMDASCPSIAPNLKGAKVCVCYVEAFQWLEIPSLSIEQGSQTTFDFLALLFTEFSVLNIPLNLYAIWDLRR